MKRSLVLLLAPLLAAGCHNASQATDPFLPRTTVPPPATGAAVGGAAAAPYYPGPASGTAAPPASSNFYAPPGDNYSYPPSGVPATAPPSGPPAPRATDNWPMTRRTDGDKQSSSSSKPAKAASLAIRSHVDSGEKSDAKLASAVTETSHPSRPKGASNEVKIVRVVAPTAKSESGAVASSDAPHMAEPRHLPPSDEAIDIMDLPPARKSRAKQASRRVVLASHQEPASKEEGSSAGVDAPEAAGRYAYAPDYRWLKGQLEYSLVDHSWKLRYIPIDGDTDAYGGSVVLEGAMPGEFHAGEFVTIYGSLSGDAATGHFAPKYRLDSITPLAE